MTFKDLEPGLFRAENLLVYSKLAEPQGEFNAVLITSGKLVTFKDDDEVCHF